MTEVQKIIIITANPSRSAMACLIYPERLRRIQRMTDSVLPIMHNAENPTMNQVNSGEFAMRRIRRPNQMAASPMRVNRTARAPKT